MQVKLLIAGETLYKSLTAALEKEIAKHSSLAGIASIQWQLVRLDDDISRMPLHELSDGTSVVLVEAAGATQLQRLRVLNSRMAALAGHAENTARAPIIMVFSSHEAMPELDDLVHCTADWAVGPAALPELAHRAVFALQKQGASTMPRRYGELMLYPTSCMLAFGEESVRLTPTEFRLADLLLSQRGAVIASSAIAEFFESFGQSTASNNIRVTIFQLRLKIESLTHLHMMLSNVYKRGYCIRHNPKQRRPAEHMAAAGGLVSAF